MMLLVFFLWRVQYEKYQTMRICVRVFLFTTDQVKESNEESQTSLITIPAHSGISFLSCVFFPLLITVIMLLKSSGENTAPNTAHSPSGKLWQSRV